MSTAIEPYNPGMFDLTHKLTVEKHGHTALITINHPPANTWDRDSLIGLKQVVEHLNRDDDVYALVVTGQGSKFFSAGADLNLFADGDKARAREMARRFGEAFETLRDFRGVSDKAFDGRGNYALGLKEQLIFPEINYDDVDKVRGMNIVFVTSANTDEECKELLTQLGIPFVQG